MATMAAKRDYYEVLGLQRTATEQEIAVSYRRLAFKYHPDKNPGDEDATKLFKEAAEAYEVLSDPDKKSRYDRMGHAGVDGSAGGSPHFTDVNDIFSAFGNIFGEGVFGDIFGGRQRGPRVQKGADVRSDVTIDLLAAARGVSKKIKFNRHQRCAECGGSGARPGSKPERCRYCNGQGQVIQSSGIFRVQTTCPACHGAGNVIKTPCTSCDGAGQVMERVEREVNVPAGVDSQTRLRLTGEGDPSPNGGPAGDCYCFVTVEDHPLFQRDGQNLICRLPITYSQAALGATVEVPTLDGPEEMKIPAGTQPGDVFKLRGRGMPDPRYRGVGDLLVQVNLEIPKNLTERQEQLLRELAKEEHTNVSPQQKSFFEKLKQYFAPEESGKQDEG